MSAVNLNDAVWVRLTPEGVVLVTAHYAAYPVLLATYLRGTVYHDQLWSLMAVLGDAMGPGLPPLIEGNQVYFEPIE